MSNDHETTAYKQHHKYRSPISHPPLHLFTMATQQDAEGYLLLTLPDTTVTQSFDGESMVLGKGELQIECVSVPISPEIGHQTANPFASSPNDPPSTHDLWLVLRVGDDFEHTLIPGNAIQAVSPPGGDGGPRYILREPAVPEAELIVNIEAPKSVTDLEDMGTLEALLTQYGVLEGTALNGLSAPVLGAGTAGISFSDEKAQPPGYTEKPGAAGSSSSAAPGRTVPPLPEKAALPTSQIPPESPIIHGGGDLRGHLVLVDETTGAVLGELETSQHDLEQVMDDHPTRPVLIDFGPIAEATRTVKVTRIPAEELDDWILRGADTLSRGILAIGAKGSEVMMTGAREFNKRTVPRPKPVTFNETTKSGIRNVHNATSKGAAVTGKTVGMINNAILRIVEGKKKNPQGQAYAAGASGTTTPKRSTLGKLKDSAMPAVGMLKEKAGYGGSSTAAGAVAPPGYAQSEKPGLAPPKLPSRPGSPGKVDTQNTAYANEKAGAAAAAAPPLSPGPASGATTPLPRKKRGFLNRSVLAADTVLSSIEAAASELVTTGTVAASSMAAHRYGHDAGQAVAYAGGSVRNAVLVYVDVRGVGRRGVLKATAKGWVKARLRSGETVALQPVPAGAQPAPVPAGHADVVINVPQASEKASYTK